MPVISIPARRPARLGFALGGGVARGWTHIGILNEFLDHGFVPDVVTGTSIGAAVAGAFAAGKLPEVEAFARSLTRRGVLRLMDLSFNGGGLLNGNRLKRRLQMHLEGLDIESLPVKFASVATEIGTGHEVWLTKGPMADAIRASYALPGIFEPVKIGGRWLFDGALVNPVPVTVCRALGADIVVAVNLSDPLVRGTIVHDGTAAGETIVAPSIPAIIENRIQDRWLDRMMSGLGERATQITKHFAPVRTGRPGIGTVLVDAFNIVQDRITRSRLSGDPPDLTIQPKFGKIQLFDFHKADELIAIGREAARKVIPELRELAPRQIAG